MVKTDPPHKNGRETVGKRSGFGLVLVLLSLGLVWDLGSEEEVIKIDQKLYQNFTFSLPEREFQ